MESATALALIAIIISLIALYQSYLSHKTSLITNIESQLTLKAQECNKLLNPVTMSHPSNTQEVSAVLTAILNAKGHLKLFYKNHAWKLLMCDEKDFIVFFKLQLHSSILELIKNEMPTTVNDLALLPQLHIQHQDCKEFLE